MSKLKVGHILYLQRSNLALSFDEEYYLEPECFSTGPCRCRGLLRTVVAQALGYQLSGLQTGIWSSTWQGFTQQLYKCVIICCLLHNYLVHQSSQLSSSSLKQISTTLLCFSLYSLSWCPEGPSVLLLTKTGQTVKPEFAVPGIPPARYFSNHYFNSNTKSHTKRFVCV